MMKRNCGFFADALCIKLGVGHIPNWVNRAAEAGAGSHAWRQVAAFLGCDAGLLDAAKVLDDPSLSPVKQPNPFSSLPCYQSPDDAKCSNGGGTPSKRLPSKRCQAFAVDGKRAGAAMLVENSYGQITTQDDSWRD